MSTKLTLKVSQKTIEKAKTHARKRKTSVSKLVENYLDKISSKEEEPTKITPLVKSLSGLLNKNKTLLNKGSYADYLSKKYR